MPKYVYSFGAGTADGDGTMKDLLGGKGSGLAEMSRAGVPVPPGFTIVTDVCNVFFDNDKQVPKEVDTQIWEMDRSCTQRRHLQVPFSLSQRQFLFISTSLHPHLRQHQSTCR